MKIYLTIILFVLLVSASAQQYHVSINSVFEVEEVAYFDPPDAFSALEGGLMIKAAGVYGESTLRYGWFINYIPSNYVYRYDFDLQMIGLGGVIGASFEVEDNIEIQPLAQIGYRVSLPSEDVDSYNGLAVNLNINGIYWLEGNVHPKLNFGFLTQPAGGNSDNTFTFSPQWFIGAGVVIADN
ncbi:hypothetical protein [Ekhidna sp.]|uniref:hypothetical protein n=1 Tax=Ekhidna sp. TaxID=2608089 RepID=UPI0032F0137E